VADDALVELDGALELGERGRLGVEVGDDVVAGVPLPDRIGQRALAQVVVLGRLPGGLRDQRVEVQELLVDGLFVQGRIEDIDHLVRTGHDTFLWSGRPGPGVGAGEEDCEGRNIAGQAGIGKKRER